MRSGGDRMGPVIESVGLSMDSTVPTGVEISLEYVSLMIDCM
ncbi:rCG30429 [Rattus norvegicus]|uniref:RCG30429 n=1 Tax=Rattus norvegicus TaxID=10116 RepID=A6JFT4_RAT|nr:rCG30429 [Rattus norvegicus]